MNDSIVTPRKLETLIAAYFGEHPRSRFSYVTGDGKPWFTYVTNMGGAAARMVEELYELGFLTTYERYEFEPDQHSNRLTVKGYDALIAGYGKVERISQKASKSMPERKTLVELMPLADLQAKRDERFAFEAARQVRREQEVQRLHGVARDRSENHRAQKIAKLREMLNSTAQTLFRFTTFLDIELIATDDQLLEFADRIASL